MIDMDVHEGALDKEQQSIEFWGDVHVHLTWIQESYFVFNYLQ